MKLSNNSHKNFAHEFPARKILTIILCLMATGVWAQTKKIKVACIGNSVTYGLTHHNPSASSYPSVLQTLLEDKYSVKNFGCSGATLLRKGHNPYATSKEFIEALAFAPDIAIIELGLNDTDPRNWPNYHDEFAADYSWLIDTFRRHNSKVKIFLTLLTPIFHEHPRFLSGTQDWFWEIQRLIPGIANSNNTGLIDFHSILYKRPDLFVDAVHPNEAGVLILAKRAYQEITGDFGGLQMAYIFQPGMVFQREKPIVFYGTSNRGEKITAAFNGLSRSVITDIHGKWKVIFPAMKAGGPYSATIASRDKKIDLNDILVGDVWLCSGQSNMAFPLKSAEHSAKTLQEAQSSTAFRLFKMNPIVETSNISWDTTTLKQVNDLHYFSGSWVKCDSANAKEFSAVGYFFGQELQTRLGVPVGLIQVAVGGSTTESWIDRYTLEHHPILVQELKNWRTSDFFQSWVRERTDLNLKLAKNHKQRHPYDPAYNFEAGIESLTGFPIKGVIWYQGESNTHNVKLHEELFPTLVKSWREKWNDNFPFYYVQLSSIDRESWTSFRYSQLELLKKIANTGMVVSSDVGDSLNVHPVKKQPVGERLARLALHFTYGQSQVVPYGPMPLSARISKQKIHIKFAYAKGLRTADGAILRGFSLTDSKGKQEEVAARIENDEVVISLSESENAGAVRYGWRPFTTANLVNGAGLPASTFKLNIR